MTGNYDWEEILNFMKSFVRVEEIKDIVIVGEKDGIRRIKVHKVKYG